MILFNKNKISHMFKQNYKFSKTKNCIIFSLAFIFLFSDILQSQELPIDFEAQSITIDNDKNIMIATGEIKLSRDNNTLTADKIVYNQITGEATAFGNVIFKTRDGIEHKSETMKLENNFSYAIAKPIISQFSQKARFSADSGEYEDKKVTIFDKSNFSPCDCDYEEGESPIWDLRATKSIHNLETKTITHNNVRMHVLGFPIFYLPILQHPDWSVNRRTGFLVPTLIYSKDKGLTTTIPFFKVLGSTNDIEYRVTNFQFRGQAVETVYRQKFLESDLNVELITGQLETFREKSENVGAIDANFNSNVGKGWNIETKLSRSSQDTFLRRYGYNNSQTLKSEVSAQKILNNKFFKVNASDLQGLGPDDTEDKEPSILPSIYYENIKEGFYPGQIIKTELSALKLDNDESNEMVRWTSLFGITQQKQTFGGYLNGEINLLGNYYDIQERNQNNSKLTEFGQSNIILSSWWNKPIGTNLGDIYGIIEPKIKATFIGGTDRTDEVPNRDSSDFRIDEANMFLTNRFQGKDFILPGSHIDIGLSGITENSFIGDISGFTGVSYTTSGESAKGLTTEETEDISDYVASLTISTPLNVEISWSGRADSNDFELNESRTSASYNIEGTTISFLHNQLSKGYFLAAEDDREEAYLNIIQKINDDFVISANQVWDLSSGETKKDKSEISLNWNGGTQNCLAISLNFKRDPYADRDVKKISEVQLLLNFKYLGSIRKSEGRN